MSPLNSHCPYFLGVNASLTKNEAIPLTSPLPGTASFLGDFCLRVRVRKTRKEVSMFLAHVVSGFRSSQEEPPAPKCPSLAVNCCSRQNSDDNYLGTWQLVQGPGRKGGNTNHLWGNSTLNGKELEKHFTQTLECQSCQKLMFPAPPYRAPVPGRFERTATGRNGKMAAEAGVHESR